MGLFALPPASGLAGLAGESHNSPTPRARVALPRAYCTVYIPPRALLIVYSMIPIVRTIDITAVLFLRQFYCSMPK